MPYRGEIMENILSEFSAAIDEKNIEKMKSIYENNKSNLDIKLLLGKYLLRSNVDDEVLGIKLLLELYNTEKYIEAIKIMSNYEYHNKNFSALLDNLQRILKDSTDTCDRVYALTNMSRVYYRQKKYDLALECLSSLKSIASISGDKDLYDSVIFMKAKVNYKIGNYRKALYEFKTVIDTKYRNKALLEFAKVEGILGYYDSAKFHIKSVLKQK